MIGKEMYSLAEKLFPICRSLTGNGVRETLAILKTKCPELEIVEIPSGTQVFDWTIPKEWNINGAWIKDNKGKIILDFKKTNLCVMGYSTPVHTTMTRDELLQYVYTEPEQPDVIPYITSYYKERFGFCMTENQKTHIINEYAPKSEFEVCIDSTLTDGFLTYGEIIIPPPPVRFAMKRCFYQPIFVIRQWLIMNFRDRVLRFFWLIGLSNYRKDVLPTGLFLYRKPSVQLPISAGILMC